MSGVVVVNQPSVTPRTDAGVEIDFATEAKLEAVRVLLASLDGKDFATQATLDAFLTAFNGEDFASQATLQALLTAFNSEDFASQATLQALLTAFNAEDFATQTTLLAADGRLATIDSVLDSIKDTDGIKKITDPVGLGAGTEIVGKVYITDGVDDATITEDLVDGKKRLDVSGKVSIVEPLPPPGATPVQISADTPLIVTAIISPHDTEYIITSGTTFTLLTVIGGSEGDSTENGSRIDIIYDNGTEHLVARGYVSGFSAQISPDTFVTRDGVTMIGTGTEKIIVRRIRLSGGSLEIDALAKGFEETT